MLNNIIKTPPLDDGCIDGVMRRVILKEKSFNIQEDSISILDIFNAKEVFVTNVISGVKWVSQIRNHKYTHQKSTEMVKLLNNKYLV